MWELLPKPCGRKQPSPVHAATQGAKSPKRGLITDIALWTKCFTALAAALSARYPDKAPPHFMAYLRTIVRASRNFDGLAWASYDAAYCRQAANNLSLDWAIPDQALYNEAFTGRARVIPRCQFCLSDSHLSHDCIFGPDDFRHSQNRQPSSRRGAVRTQVAQICRLFNQPGGNQCHFKQCRYAHLLASATGHTQRLSVTGASATVPGQPRLQARRGKRKTGRLLLMHLLLTC